MERRGRGGVDNTLAAGIRSRVGIRCSAAKFFSFGEALSTSRFRATRIV